MLSTTTRKKIVEWLVKDVARHREKFICFCAVNNFSERFQRSVNANPTNVKRLEKSKSEISPILRLSLDNLHALAITINSKSSHKLVLLKANSGKKRCPRPCVDALHSYLREKFDRLSNLGLQICLSKLQLLANNSVTANSINKDSANMIVGRKDKPLYLIINQRWVQLFATSQKIVSRVCTGERRLSLNKKSKIEIDVKHNLRALRHFLFSTRMNKKYFFNTDKIYFMINSDNGWTLGFNGETETDYAIIVSKREGFTMLAHLSGSRNAKVKASCLGFKNVERNYPIQCMGDSVPNFFLSDKAKMVGGWSSISGRPESIQEAEDGFYS